MKKKEQKHRLNLVEEGEASDEEEETETPAEPVGEEGEASDETEERTEAPRRTEL